MKSLEHTKGTADIGNMHDLTQGRVHRSTHSGGYGSREQVGTEIREDSRLHRNPQYALDMRS